MFNKTTQKNYNEAFQKVFIPANYVDEYLPEKQCGIKYDSDKLQWWLLPLKLLRGVVKILMFGAKKYAAHNWMKVGDGKRRYYDAMMRHIEELQRDDGTIDLNHIDPDSKMPTLWHIQCNAIFLEKFRQDEENGI